MQCLEKTESQRPSSAGELAAELRSVEYAAHADGVQEGQTEVMNREDLPPARRFGRVAAVAVTVAAILGVVLALFWFSGFGRPPETQARPTRYVEVEINGQLERARFHNLTEDAESGVVSLEDGQIVLVPVDDLVFVTEDSR